MASCALIATGVGTPTGSIEPESFRLLQHTQFVSLVMGLSDFISDPGDFSGVKTMNRSPGGFT
jgi:hypothetical protein